MVLRVLLYLHYEISTVGGSLVQGGISDLSLSAFIGTCCIALYTNSLVFSVYLHVNISDVMSHVVLHYLIIHLSGW